METVGSLTILNSFPIRPAQRLRAEFFISSIVQYSILSGAFNVYIIFVTFRATWIAFLSS
jgi:hypothetical protein